MVRRVVSVESHKLRADRVLQEDIHSFALEGLSIAMDKYDESRGASFEYYAEKQIRWTIYDNLRKTCPVPRETHRRSKFLSSAKQLLNGAAKAPPPKGSTEAVHRLAESMKGLATSFVVTVVAEKIDHIAAEPPVAESSLVEKESRQTLLECINTLPEKEKRVVISHYFEDRTLTDIASEMNVTTSWTSKILSNALKHLRGILCQNPELLSALKDP